MKNKTPTWEQDFERWIESGISQSTKRARHRDVIFYWKWVKTHHNEDESYPAKVEHILQFCLYHIKDDSPYPLKLSTLRRYLGSLSVIHTEQGLQSPTQNPKVKILLRRAKAAKKEKPNKKAAITLDILKALLETCDDSLMGIRDKAILLVGFASGGRRRSEISQFNVEDLHVVEDGYLITMNTSKTDKNCEGKTLPIFGEAAHALKIWLIKSGLRQGPLFRGIKPDNSFYPTISGRTINLIVKRRIALMGLNPDDFGAHSLRAGFLTESSHQGINLTEAMMLSGHRSYSIAQGYCRDNIFRNNKASYLV